MAELAGLIGGGTTWVPRAFSVGGATCMPAPFDVGGATCAPAPLVPPATLLSGGGTTCGAAPFAAARASFLGGTTSAGFWLGGVTTSATFWPGGATTSAGFWPGGTTTSAGFCPGGATTFAAGVKRALPETAATAVCPAAGGWTAAPAAAILGAATPFTHGFSSMNFSSSCIASSPLASVLKLWITARRAWTSSFMRSSLALSTSSLSLFFVAKRFIMWAAACSCKAPPPAPGIQACILRPCAFGTGTSSNGLGAPAPASFRCATTSCRSACRTSSAQAPFLM
mmetsp:Transcript_43185/g.103537  ORF Transcript_43185/g.103537 Transcript_43185/m.103537 type:complete len:283 (+) Transcript_43185:830-1678(+)